MCFVVAQCNGNSLSDPTLENTQLKGRQALESVVMESETSGPQPSH